MVKTQLTDKVIKRLTLYHCILFDYIEQNIEFISSPQIAKLLNIDDSQVRKDIKLLNNSGKCKVGYDVKCLKKSIEKTLGFENPKNAFIVGAGNLGMALAKYSNFKDYGLNIMALFDNDKSKFDCTKSLCTKDSRFFGRWKHKIYLEFYTYSLKSSRGCCCLE